MRVLSVICLVILAACGSDELSVQPGEGAVIYPAAAVVTMQAGVPDTTAIAVSGTDILALGSREDLEKALPAARVDLSFADKTIVPGLIDPHVHMDLSSILYGTPLTPPWPMATREGMVEGLADRDAFFSRLREIVGETPPNEPVFAYGYHDLVFGDIDRQDLDEVTDDRPLIVWHYSAHDFYLNTPALAYANIDASLHDRFEGIDLDEFGQPTGRVYEDATTYLLQYIGPDLLSPKRVQTGLDGFSELLRHGGVTTVADLGYGIFGFDFSDANIISNWRDVDHAGYRLYLVPEHRAFQRVFGDERIAVIKDMVSGARRVPAPVLPQVKFFTDAAFYSQTMRLSSPGYLSGQSEGTEGLWVMKPGEIAQTIRPYWDAGLDVHIHSNGDAAQSATLAALKELRPDREDQRFVFEHAGLFSPEQVAEAAALDAIISAASHYVYYLGEAYQAPLGEPRGDWILPLGSMRAAGVPVTLHSDAPLAPPLPLRAASVHLLRSTREGGVLTPDQVLTPQEAMEAITINAALALGLEDEIGSLAPGKRADFTILDANPMETPAADWPNIGVWGVVVSGKLRPLEPAEAG